MSLSRNQHRSRWREIMKMHHPYDTATNWNSTVLSGATTENFETRCVLRFCLQWPQLFGFFVDGSDWEETIGKRRKLSDVSSKLMPSGTFFPSRSCLKIFLKFRRKFYNFNDSALEVLQKMGEKQKSLPWFIACAAWKRSSRRSNQKQLKHSKRGLPYALSSSTGRKREKLGLMNQNDIGRRHRPTYNFSRQSTAEKGSTEILPTRDGHWIALLFKGNGEKLFVMNENRPKSPVFQKNFFDNSLFV